MPIEFSRIAYNTSFNKLYGDYTSISGYSTFPYTQGWTNRFGPPGANERIDSDGYDLFANPGICIGSGINQFALIEDVSNNSVITNINGTNPNNNTYEHKSPWFGPVNNIYKITISGIINYANNGVNGSGNCDSCDLLNGTYYVNTTYTSIRTPPPTSPTAFGNTLVSPPDRIQNHIGSIWTSPISRNKDAPCGNKLFSTFDGGFYSAVFAYEPTSEFINLALIQDQGTYGGFNPISSGNIVLQVYIGKSLGDVRSTEFTQSDVYNCAFSKNFGPLNLSGGHENDNRPLMLEGIHNLTPATGTLFYGTLIHNSGDNKCDYSNATCTVEPYKTADWDFRQTRHYFENPYGLISYHNIAPMCSGIEWARHSLGFSATYGASNGYANLIPSAFTLSLSGVSDKLSNPLCLPCNTYFFEPVTLKQVSSTVDTFGESLNINRYEWSGDDNSSSFLTKYNICEYGAYEYIRTHTGQSASLFNLSPISSLNPTNPSGYISYGLNKIRFDIISSGILVGAGGSGYQSLSATAELSFVNGPAIGPKFTKILCTSLSDCTNGSVLVGSTYLHSGILPCLSSNMWNGGWTVDSGIIMEPGYGVSPGISGIFHDSSVAHLCDFTSSVPILRTNTSFSSGLIPMRFNPTIFCTNKQVPQTLTINYTSISGSLTNIYNKIGLTNSWTNGSITLDNTDDFYFDYDIDSSLTGGSLPGNWTDGVISSGTAWILGTNIGSRSNRIMDCSAGNWTKSIRAQYHKTNGFGPVLDFDITFELSDFTTVDYP